MAVRNLNHLTGHDHPFIYQARMPNEQTESFPTAQFPS